MLIAMIVVETARAVPVIPVATVTPAHPDVGPILTGVASICSAVIWPLVIVMVLWMFRAQAIDLLKAAVTVAEGANRFRIWQIEFDRDVSQQVAQSTSSAVGTPIVAHAASAAEMQMAATIPQPQVVAASGVRALLDAAPNSTLRRSAEAAIRTRMLGFCQEYETTRASMAPGADRTRAMNAVVAKMRTLALAADLYLQEFMAAPSAGQHLAAVCILQMKPQLDALGWLVERMRVEQPFVFFHASVALLNAVRQFGAAERARLMEAIRTATASVRSFGPSADENTIRVLTLAQSELDGGDSPAA